MKSFSIPPQSAVLAGIDRPLGDPARSHHHPKRDYKKKENGNEEDEDPSGVEDVISTLSPISSSSLSLS